MATNLEKLQGNKAAVPMEIMETNFDNIKMSYDQHIAFYRKKKEIKAKLELERVRLEEEAAKEQEALENVGAEDTKEIVKTEEE